MKEKTHTPPPANTKGGDKPTSPMTKKEDVANSPDEKTDEDFPNFPHPPSKEETIKKDKKESA